MAGNLWGTDWYQQVRENLVQLYNEFKNSNKYTFSVKHNNMLLFNLLATSFGH